MVLMNRIKLLDSVTTQKIAAGEVVERPISIVKELLENSIDAGASSIVVEIKNGGKSYIRVSDNGYGIVKDDLELAFMRHSTSKLDQIEDLSEITSLGFRGEALASIAIVSKLEVITKTKNDRSGTFASLEEGKFISINPVGAPVGTTIVVKDLFYNIPVRREFLKSDLVESNRISDIVYKLALGNPNISFKFIKDGKILLQTTRNNNFKNHVYSILGRDFTSNLLDLSYSDDNIQISGFLGNNEIYRGNRSHQYLYINGRYVENIHISNIIENNFKSLIPINKYPVYIILMEISPKEIDVNIHPTKQEVKFTRQDLLLDKIDNLIKDTLTGNRKIPEIISKKDTNPIETVQVEPVSLFDLAKVKKEIDIPYDEIKAEKVDFLKETMEAESNDFFLEGSLSSQNEEAINQNEYKSTEELSNIFNYIIPKTVLFKTYIVCEDKLNKKVYFIDQHAAHERIMYEKLMEEYSKEQVVSQDLLSPLNIDLTPKELDLFLDNISIFQDLGFQVEQFGPSSVIVRSIPLVFGKSSKIKDMFFDILDNIKINIKTSYDLRLDKIIKQSCTQAVKSGDNMDDLEIIALFDQLKLCENPFNCPHGRPTLIEMSQRELEKEFLRIM